MSGFSTLESKFSFSFHRCPSSSNFRLCLLEIQVSSKQWVANKLYVTSVEWWVTRDNLAVTSDEKRWRSEAWGFRIEWSEEWVEWVEWRVRSEEWGVSGVRSEEWGVRSKRTLRPLSSVGGSTHSGTEASRIYGLWLIINLNVQLPLSKKATK